MSELTLDPALLNELAIQKQEYPSQHIQKDNIQISWAQNDNEVKEAQQLDTKYLLKRWALTCLLIMKK
jgi:hypothetical protein